MKFLKCLTMVALVATTVFATSCKKDEPITKPTGFGLQGTWKTAGTGVGGKSFQFDAAVSTATANYIYVLGSTNEGGTYEYSFTSNPMIDKITINPNRDGAPKETYEIRWVTSSWTSFALVATGATPSGAQSKEGNYSK